MNYANYTTDELIRLADNGGDGLSQALAQRLHACTLEHESEKAELLEEVKTLEARPDCDDSDHEHFTEYKEFFEFCVDWTGVGNRWMWPAGLKNEMVSAIKEAMPC